MQSNRRRSLPAVAIAQNERWIQDTQAEDNKNYLPNTAATEDVNELPAVRTRKTQKKSWHIVWIFLLIEGKGCCWDCKGSLKK